MDLISCSDLCKYCNFHSVYASPQFSLHIFLLHLSDSSWCQVLIYIRCYMTRIVHRRSAVAMAPHRVGVLLLHLRTETCPVSDRVFSSIYNSGRWTKSRKPRNALGYFYILIPAASNYKGQQGHSNVRDIIFRAYGNKIPNVDTKCRSWSQLSVSNLEPKSI
jgi:hypothetical protein